MEGLVLSCVFFCVVVGSSTVSTLQVEEDYEIQIVTPDAPDTDLENEINASYDDASLDNFGVDERLKRAAVPEQVITVGQHNSRINHTEVYATSPGGKVYWKDNIETQRLRQGEATVIRVIHHGIYPSLNVTEPIGRTDWTSRFAKSRTKRDGFGRNAGSSSTRTDYRYESTGSINGTFHRETSFRVKDGPRTVYDGRNSQDGSVYTAYQAQYPPNNVNRPRYNSTNIRNPTPRVTKFVREKRNSGFGGNPFPPTSRSYDYRYNSTGSSNGTLHRETSVQVKNGSDSDYSRWDNRNGTVKTTYQAHYPPFNSNNFHNPNYDSVRNFSYARAIHPVNGSKDYSFYTHQFQQPITNRTNSTTKHRTLYFPASNSADNPHDYKGETNNKGNVRLISVGYYSINESRDGVRSYYSPPGRDKTGYRESPTTNRFEPSRYRRSTSRCWGWLDSLCVSIGLAKLEEAQNEIPAGSETVKLEVGDGGNEVLQNHYGYSSNGHHHVVPTQIDRIYLVGGASPTSTVPTPVAAAVNTMEQVTSDATNYEDISGSSEELQLLLPGSRLNQEAESTMQPMLPTPSALLPHTGTVLIQAPPRMIDCRPPKRLARGRCRTVW